MRNSLVIAILFTLALSACRDSPCLECCETENSFLHGSDQFNIPHIITPNGDGFNDALIISGLEEFPDNRVIIMQRGIEVATYEGYNNNIKVFGESKRVSSGLYTYSISIDDKTYTGKFCLLKSATEIQNAGMCFTASGMDPFLMTCAD